MSNYLSRTPPKRGEAVLASQNISIEEETKEESKHASSGTYRGLRVDTQKKDYGPGRAHANDIDVQMIEEDVNAEDARTTEMHRSTIALNVRFNEKGMLDNFKNSFLG